MERGGAGCPGSSHRTPSGRPAAKIQGLLKRRSRSSRRLNIGSAAIRWWYVPKQPWRGRGRGGQRYSQPAVLAAVQVDPAAREQLFGPRPAAAVADFSDLTPRGG